MKTVIGAILLASGMSVAHAQGPTASANMIDADEGEAGTVSFETTRSGTLRIIVEMVGLPPGPHGLHLHETGQCSIGDGFKSAGGHIAGDRAHGINAEDGPHPGDLPNVHVAGNGVLKVEFFTDRVSLEGGPHALLDGDGTAVIVHSGPDDYTSQPSGDAGDRIAYGVVRR